MRTDNESVIQCVRRRGKRDSPGHAVYLSRRSNLTCTDLAESSLPQHSVHPECLVCDWLTFQEFPLKIPQEVHRVLELFERNPCQE